MHITAHLDVDMVAVETEDDVSVLLEIVRRAPGWCFILGPLMGRYSGATS
jgi:sporulation-control protein spo0M